MNEILEIWSEHKYYGYRKITAILKDKDYIINSKKVRRLMKIMDIEAIYPKPRTS